MVKIRNAALAQTLSTRDYGVTALVGLIIGVALLFFYVYQVPRLVEGGAESRVFYLLLIPWALSCAAFLFGAMRSYANFTHRRFGNALELGGPVVFFCLVLAGGFKLVPAPPETFDLSVRAHSVDGTVPLITSGKILLELDHTLSANIGSDGEAEFKGILAKYKGPKVRILAQVDGYKPEWQTHQLRGKVVDLPLTRAPQAVTHLTGQIVPAPENGRKVRIFVEGQKADTSPDELGRFDLPVNGKNGDRVRLNIYVGGKLVADDYYTLPGPARIKLDERR